MKRAVLILKFNDADSFVNIEADRFSITEAHIIAYNGEDMVGIWRIETVISAHISTKEK